ncbi:uncharacterized protein LAESUDRAFT_732275 [Laetiporus sulphureus 93-53]|uniref:Uncharacterized protein n=1 Tax=Laetiporus sulphureus 93-53 TaxID=1314785 RepID=A0A165B7C1_9APHY|nr:uncharacterized protein LAESUDRAFT_732275 [Laetiporus sulphureus 93-53]KZT00411.1 hypothetical protein LAESUDRAFT_732275 [Laetiporus sulphureus 93-53]
MAPRRQDSSTTGERAHGRLAQLTPPHALLFARLFSPYGHPSPRVSFTTRRCERAADAGGRAAHAPPVARLFSPPWVSFTTKQCKRAADARGRAVPPHPLPVTRRSPPRVSFTTKRCKRSANTRGRAVPPHPLLFARLFSPYGRPLPRVSFSTKRCKRAADARGRGVPPHGEHQPHRRGYSHSHSGSHSRSRSRGSSISLEEMLLEATTGDDPNRRLDGAPAALARPHAQSLSHHPSQHMVIPRMGHRSQSPDRRDRAFHLGVPHNHAHSRSGASSSLSAHPSH